MIANVAFDLVVDVGVTARGRRVYCLGPEAVEKLESYALSYSEEFCILEAERDRKEVYTDYVGVRVVQVRLG